MGKEILMFGDVEIESINITAITVLLFRRCRYRKRISIWYDFYWRKTTAYNASKNERVFKKT